MDSFAHILLPILLTFPIPTPSASKIKNGTTSSVENPSFKPQKCDFKGFNFLCRCITHNDVFADKSLLMKDFAEHPAKVILVTCPRGWGKTMTTGMVELFFQPHICENGSQVDRQDAPNYKLFVHGEWGGEKITPLKIAQHRDFVGRYLGQSPVICLCLEGIFHGFESLKWETGGVFSTHLYVINRFGDILKSSSASEAEKKATQAHRDLFMKFYLKNFTEEESIGSLQFLSERLYEYFGRKPFILVDSYDKWINRLLTGSHGRKVTPELKQSVNRRVEFLRRFLLATFSDDHFEKGLVTGAMNLEIPRIFSGLPNFKHFNVIRNDFYRYFGMTEGEIDILFDGCHIKGKLAKDAKRWFGGYAVTNDNAVSLYNIQSMRNFFMDFKAFFDRLDGTSNCCAFDSLLGKEKIKSIVASLVNGTCFEIELNDLSFSIDDYYTLMDMVGCETKVTESGINAYLRLLLSEGLLTIDHGSGSTTLARGYVKVPNQQVAWTFKVRDGI